MNRATVSLVRCASYELDQVEAALDRLLEPLGGMVAHVSPGQRVLLKPNFIAPRSHHRGTHRRP